MSSDKVSIRQYATYACFEKYRGLHGEKLEESYKNCQLGTYHYISRGHILSYAYCENGVTPGLNILGQRGASLKYVPCGGLVESAAQSNDYQNQLSLVDPSWCTLTRSPRWNKQALSRVVRQRRSRKIQMVIPEWSFFRCPGRNSLKRPRSTRSENSLRFMLSSRPFD